MKQSDYNIIKVRYYASDYLLKKWHDGGEQPRQHWDRALHINKLFWDFVKLITGKEHEYFMYKWMLDTKDCVIEYLFENYNIIIDNKEKYYFFFLPKSMEKEFEWIQKNSKAPYKILKRKSVEHYSRCITNWRREDSEKFTKNSTFYKHYTRQIKLKKLLNES